jgi:GntR family transcriptional regulator/MocR family aminotransferase
MFPSLRVAYLVVPLRLCAAFAAARAMAADQAPMTTQLALARFIEEGHLNSHLRRLRQRCSERRDALHAAVQRWVPRDIELGPTDAGLQACLHLPPDLPDARLLPLLQCRQVGAEALSARCWQVRGRNGLIVGWAASNPDEIDAAIRRLADAIAELRNDSSR